jgi:hypothetical protein
MTKYRVWTSDDGYTRDFHSPDMAVIAFRNILYSNETPQKMLKRLLKDGKLVVKYEFSQGSIIRLDE